MGDGGVGSGAAASPAPIGPIGGVAEALTRAAAASPTRATSAGTAARPARAVEGEAVACMRGEGRRVMRPGTPYPAGGARLCPVRCAGHQRAACSSPRTSPVWPSRSGRRRSPHGPVVPRRPASPLRWIRLSRIFGVSSASWSRSDTTVAQTREFSASHPSVSRTLSGNAGLAVGPRRTLDAHAVVVRRRAPGARDASDARAALRGADAGDEEGTRRDPRAAAVAFGRRSAPARCRGRRVSPCAHVRPVGDAGLNHAGAPPRSFGAPLHAGTSDAPAPVTRRRSPEGRKLPHAAPDRVGTPSRWDRGGAPPAPPEWPV